MQTILENYPTKLTIPVAWGDMDAFGHVNNVNFFRYFESARVAYFDSISLLTEMKATGIGGVVSQTECQYFLPLTYPDTICVGAKISKLGESSFIMDYEIFSERIGKCCAKGSAKIVMFDFNKNRKTAIPMRLLTAINQLQPI